MVVKLVLSGNKAYVKRMFKHLRSEHPSTRPRMKLMINKYKGGKK